MKKTDLAFTRIELLFCVLGAALVVVPAISLLASNKSESQRIVCFNNLRQIGRGFRVWANEHDDRFPWRVPSQTEGGTYQNSLGGNVWFQFLWVSNQIGSPKVLVCPADTSTLKMAITWGFTLDGFAYANFRNNALSYIIALHAVPDSGTSLLSADENIAASARNMACSLLPSPVCVQLSPFDMNVRWTNAIHGTSGHLLFGDGSVQFTTSAELRLAVPADSDNGSGVHYLRRE